MESRPLSIVTNEKQCIQCLIESPPLMSEVDDNYFVSDIARALYATLVRLKSFEVEPTHTNIINEGNKINSGITFDLLSSLEGIEHKVEDFSYYVRRLKEEYAKKKMSDDLLKNLTIEFTKKGELDTNRIEDIRDEITYYLDMLKGKKSSMYDLSEMLDKYEQVINEREAGKHFYPTGNVGLDSMLLQGFYPGWITTLFAATGIGKSVYALNLINGQINRGIPSLYISLEMDMISTMDRLIALRNKIPINLLYPDAETKSLGHVHEILEKEREVLKNMKNFYFVEEPALDHKDIQSIVKEAKKKMGVDYLIATIDLMSMTKDFHERGDKQSTIYEDAIDKYHILAKEERIHILGVVQANREIEKFKPSNWDEIEKLRPTRNSIKNSGAIAERSRIVLGAFRAKFYGEMFLPTDVQTQTTSDYLDIDILKQNMGKLGRIQYLYNGECAHVDFLPEKVFD